VSTSVTMQGQVSPVTAVRVRAFLEGDEVVLAEGAYQGSQGVFLHLRKDPNWADIRERNGAIRSHPVAWLELAKCNP
jgi:hypothetical protein